LTVEIEVYQQEIERQLNCCITTAYKTIACHLLNSKPFIAPNETQQRILSRQIYRVAHLVNKTVQSQIQYQSH